MANMSNTLVTENMTTTSKLVAGHFGKAHRDVIRAIDNLECGDEFKVRNFAHCEFVNDKGVTYAGYTITRDGFSLLCMGFTGAKAMKWKLSFLKAFNLMEKELLKKQNALDWKAARLQGKAIRRSTTDTIKEFVEYATNQGSKNARRYYENITKMEYKALDMLEQSKNVTGNFRDTLDLMQIGFLQVAENIATLAIQKGMADELNYRDIYTLAKQKVTEYAHSVSWAKLEYKGQ
jgi:Rha family phage regulatory protein